jgi:hypothetical protein
VHHFGFHSKNRTIVLVFLHWHEGLLTIAQSTRVCASIPVFLHALDNGRKVHFVLFRS